MNPGFSVIMTSFNYGRYIGVAIESVLAQTRQDWELLIVDDCSQDDSWEIVKRYPDPRIKAHRHSVNQGACAAYNRALNMARGDYIASLDSDDLFMPTKLERQGEFLASHPEVGICGTFVVEIDGDGGKMTEQSPFADWFNVAMDLNAPENWMRENRLCHSGAVVRTELHKLVGDFDNKLVYTPDWQFWVRSLVAGVRFHVLDQPLVGYRNHGANITHKNTQGAMLEQADTSARFFIPWLVRQERLDLVDRIVRSYVSDGTSDDLQRKIAERLCHGGVDSGMALMSLVRRQDAELAARDVEINRLAQGNEWLSSQREAWENAATEREQTIGRLMAQLQANAEQLATALAELAARDARLAMIRQDRGMRVTNFLRGGKFF